MKPSQRRDAKTARRKARVVARSYGSAAHVRNLGRGRNPRVTATQVEAETLLAVQRELARTERYKRTLDLGVEKMQKMLTRVTAL